MTVEAGLNMSSQETTNTSSYRMPRGGAELEYPNEGPNSRMPRGGAELEYPTEGPNSKAQQELPPLKAHHMESWVHDDDQTTETETGFDTDTASEGTTDASPAANTAASECSGTETQEAAVENQSAPVQESKPFTYEETVFIFDWDDTILPSAWVQSQGLRLDEESHVNEWQREELDKIAEVAIETIRLAKQYGTVVLVTNAERGWIELSCQKFLPSIAPMLENVKLLSARTTYESRDCASPLEWKLLAFRDEIWRLYGADVIESTERRKNCFSLGDSMHEREALLRATASMPNCRSKSLKFVERPDISQLCKQHSLISGCWEKIVHHDGNLDLCIRCN